MKGSYHTHLTDEQFEMIAQYFPTPRKPPSIPLRKCIEAILYVMKEGCSWRGLPYEYREKQGDWHTIYTRHKRWTENGTWSKVLGKLQAEGVLEVRIVFLDSTVVRAHHDASGAQKKRDLKQ